MQGSLLAGLATGARSVAALAALARARRPGPLAVVATLAQAGEIVADKLPVTPSRLEVPGVFARLVVGAVTGGLVADHDQVVAGAVVGAVGSAASSWLGARGRALAAARLGSDLPGAVVEDVLAVALARAALGAAPA